MSSNGSSNKMFSEYVDNIRNEVKTYLTKGKANLEEAILKAESFETLSLEELASLITATKPEHRQRILNISKDITRHIHGKDIGLIAPLYIDNNCNNKCRYCGMSKNNTRLERRRIESLEAFRQEIEVLKLVLGYYTVEIVAGGCLLDLERVNQYIDTMETYGIENTAFFFDTLSIDEYHVLFSKHPQITMVHWQETYLREKYTEYHPKDTHKGDYAHRVDAIETALAGNLQKYAIGVLFGLADPKEDVLICIGHGRYLHTRYGLEPRALGIVRLQPTRGAEIVDMPYPVDESAHLFFSAILRLAFPRADMIATTRENLNHVSNLLKYAATFTNATCTTIPGGYSSKIRKGIQTDGQFYHNSPTYATVMRMIQDADLNLNPHRPL
jgi:2-iminoacetate synthase